MNFSIKRLGPGDESILHLLATEDADFNLEGRGEATRPLDNAAARCYLENSAVLHWIALDAEVIVGSLYCLVVPLRSDRGQEVLLYEIGVRRAWRRRGVGRALLAQMEQWMRENDITEVWVLADNPDAVTFYRAGGFIEEEEQPVYLTRDLDAHKN